MSSTTTTWSTDTNTKSGSATTYTDTVSSLRLVGGEGEDAILRLFADEGDDNADQWRIVSQASTNKLNFMSFASGSWSNVMNLFGSGTAASQYLSIQTGNKLYLDGTGDTYIQESSADVLDIYVGGANMIKLTESTTDTMTITGQLTVGVDGTGYDVKFFGATASNGYMLWDESEDDLIFGASSKVGIGVTDPDSKLEINGTTSNMIHLKNTSGAGARIQFEDSGDTGYVGIVTTNDITYIGGAAGASSLNINILSTGEVGIGTTAPEAKLEVRGGTGTAFGGAGHLRLSTAELSVASGTNDVLGMISFSAPLEGSGSDAILPSAAIWAEAEVSNFSTSDNSTALVFATADSETAIATANERMRIDADGKVGIGTNDPAAILDIEQDATDAVGLRLANFPSSGSGNAINDTTSIIWAHKDSDADYGQYTPVAIGTKIVSSSDRKAEFFIAVSDSDNYDLDNDVRFTVTEDGTVGIGTTSPSEMLHIESAVGTDMLLKNTGSAAIVIKGDANRSGADQGILAMTGYWNGTNVAMIDFKSGADTSNKDDGEITFQTAAAGSLIERMRIDNAGNVGIGTASPDYTLDVEKAVTSDWLSRIYNTATTSNPSGLLIRLDDADSTGTILGLNASGTYRMVVKADGKVGIGTAIPYAILNVRQDESATLTDFTQANPKSGLLIESDYTVDAYTPGVFWSTGDNNATKPKAGIWLRTTGSGSKMFLGTSNNYNTGITNQALTVNYNGNVGIGIAVPRKALDVVDSAVIRGKANFTLTGSIDVTGTNANVPGTGTKYTEELVIGDKIVVSGETRTIASITNDTTATVTSAWGSDLADDASPDCHPAAFTVLDAAGTGVDFVVDTNGFVGVGTAYPEHPFHVKALRDSNYTAAFYNSDADNARGINVYYSGGNGFGGGTDYAIVFNDTDGIHFAVSGDGTATITGAGTAVTSDRRIKSDIVDATSKLDDINKLKVRNFDFITADGRKDGKKHIGFIADEFEEVFPSMVKKNEGKFYGTEYTDLLSISDGALIPILVKAVQELTAKVEALENNNE